MASTFVLRQHLHGIALVASMCVLGGCATPGGDPTASARSFLGSFFSQDFQTFKSLVEGGDFTAAHHYYVAHASDIDEARAKPLLARMVSGINATFVPAAERLSASLDAQQAALPAAQWPAARKELDDAANLLQSYDGFALLTREGFRADAIRGLQKGRAEAVARWGARAGAAFARHEHAREPGLFFSRYPVELDSATKAQVLREQSDTWQKALQRAPASRLQEMATSFAGGLDDPALSGQIVSAFKEATIQAKGWRKPLAGRNALALAMLTRQAFPDAASAQPDMAWLTVAERADGQASPGGTDPFGAPMRSVTLTELPRALAELEQGGPRAGTVLMVLDRPRAVERILAVEPVRGQRVVGQRQEPNPELQELRSEVRRLEQTYQEVAQQDRQLQQQAQDLARQSGGSGLSGLMAVLGSGTGSYLVANAKQEMEAARQRLASTPPTLTKPVVEPYTLASARVERTVTQQATLYVLAADGKGLERFTAQASATRQAEAFHHVSEQDARSADMAAHNTRARATLDSAGSGGPLLTPAAALEAVSAAKTPAATASQDQLLAMVQGDLRAFQADADARQLEAEKKSAPAQAQLERIGAMDRQAVASAAAAAPSPARGGQQPAASVSHCPATLDHLRSRARYAVLRDGPELSQSLASMIAEAGGVDRAIAKSQAQKRDFELQRDTARESALAVAARPGEIETPCDAPTGMYCSSNYAYHLLKDAIELTDGTIDALACHKAGGAR